MHLVFEINLKKLFEFYIAKDKRERCKIDPSRSCDLTENLVKSWVVILKQIIDVTESV